MAINKQFKAIERQLRGMLVYKPYVYAGEDSMYVESYPLTVKVWQGFDANEGPYHYLTLRDSSLTTLGERDVLTSRAVHIGQDLVSIIGRMLKDFHAESYDRAKSQERDALRMVAVGS